MNLKAIKKKVVCKKSERKRMTDGGIHLPDVIKDDVAMVKVISLGEDATKELAVGMKAVVSGYQGASHKIAGEEFVIYEDDQILAIVEDND